VGGIDLKQPTLQGGPEQAEGRPIENRLQALFVLPGQPFGVPLFRKIL
jgi:hypothetical protein